MYYNNRMKTLFANAKVFTYTNGGYKLIARDFAAENGLICPDVTNCNKTIDLKGKIVIPMFVDIHCHGAVGYDFNTVTNFEQIDLIADYFLNFGTGTLLASIMTDSLDTMLWQIKLLSSYISSRHNNIKGIHLEGPFLSKQYKGAMDSKYIQDANLNIIKRFVNEGNGLIKQVTLSPELTNIEELTQYLIDNNIVVSMGHSGANNADTNKLIALGANNFTHVFNAMPGLSHKTENILSVALTNDKCYTEAIIDCKHLCENTIKIIYRQKSSDKLILITDSIMASGLGDGEYSLANQQIMVTDGDAVIRGTSTRAGSTLNMFTAFSNLIKLTNCSMIDAIKCSSINAAALIGLNISLLNPKENADFIVLVTALQNFDIYVNGNNLAK